MIHLFTHVPVTQKSVRPNQIPLLLRDYQVDGSSGVLWLGGIDDSQIIMLLVEGMTIYLARLFRDSRETVDLSQLSSLLPSRNSIVRTAWLPAEGVRIAKAILDWYPPVDTRSCETHDFAALLQDWSQTPGNGVIRVTWAGAEGFVLLYGSSTPATAMYAGSGRVLMGTEALSTIHSQPEGPCTVAWYRAPHLPALPEGEIAPLREAFSVIVMQLYQNYAHLAGVGLMQVLLTELNRKAVGNGWQIRFKANLVEDHQDFPSMVMAAGVYRQLLHELAQHTSMVVGLQVTDRLFREALDMLPESTRVVLQQYEVV